MLHDEIIFLETLQPAGYLSFRVTKIQQPPQSSMICTNNNIANIQVRVKMLYCTDNGQELPGW